jgi:uncharacterized repeat protein (TIGR03803 family)
MTKALQHRGSVSGFCVRITTATLLAVALAPAIQAQTFTVLYTFTGMNDQNGPDTTLLRDSAGNLFGTTVMDSVFKLSPSGKLTTIHTFRGFRFPDGLNGLFMTPQGIFYDTSARGGHYEEGTLLRVLPSGGATQLWQFSGVQDGATPSGGLIRDAEGIFYGVTAIGGAGNCNQGCNGTVFKIDLEANPIEQVLYSFTGGADGETPTGTLARDAAGNLYGTTRAGGKFGWGTVFKLDKTGKETVLHAFTGGADGNAPWEGVIRDSAGNLYGTTLYGGDVTCSAGGFNGCGVVFKVNKSGKLTVLHTFEGGMNDGAAPIAGLVQDSSGNLYGTTVDGGALSCLNGDFGCGVVFKINASNTFTILHAFTGGNDGLGPAAGVTLDSAGNIYGAAGEGGGTGCTGGFGCGVIFKITP